MEIDHKKEPRERIGIMASASDESSGLRWVMVAELTASVGLHIGAETARMTVAEARRLADQIYIIAERTEKRLSDVSVDVADDQ